MPTTMLVVEKAINQHDLEYVIGLHDDVAVTGPGDTADGADGADTAEGDVTDTDAGTDTDTAEGGEAPESYVVVVPVGKENGKVLATLDDLALGNFKGAEQDSRDEPMTEAVAEARDAMTATVEAFQKAGKQATGELLAGAPVDGLKQIAARYGVDEIIVLTVPHLVEEFFHRDLASRLRKATDLPTLRLLAHVPLD